MKRIARLAKHLTHGSEPHTSKPRSRLNRLEARFARVILKLVCWNSRNHSMLHHSTALGQSLKRLMSMDFASWRNLSTKMSSQCWSGICWQLLPKTHIKMEVSYFCAIFSTVHCINVGLLHFTKNQETNLKALTRIESMLFLPKPDNSMGLRSIQLCSVITSALNSYCLCTFVLFRTMWRGRRGGAWCRREC